MIIFICRFIKREIQNTRQIYIATFLLFHNLVGWQVKSLKPSILDFSILIQVSEHNVIE